MTNKFVISYTVLDLWPMKFSYEPCPKIYCWAFSIPYVY